RSVVAVGAYASEALRGVASVMLPAAGFAETAGTYVNLEGRWQSWAAAARLLGQARPAWKILRVLGNLMELKGFGYDASEQVRDELIARLGRGAGASDASGASGQIPVEDLPDTAGAREPVVDVPMYAID